MNVIRRLRFKSFASEEQKNKGSHFLSDYFSYWITVLVGSRFTTQTWGRVFGDRTSNEIVIAFLSLSHFNVSIAFLTGSQTRLALDGLSIN